MTEEPPKEAYTRTMNKLPVDPKNVKIRTTSFDNVLMRNIRLTQVPSFLIQHVGSPGYYRFENFLSQKLSSFAHTNQGYGLRWLYVFCGLSLLPNFYATYVREKRLQFFCKYFLLCRVVTFYFF